jgi:FPC/CPF motif-containing protein YcgG
VFWFACAASKRSLSRGGHLIEVIDSSGSPRQLEYFLEGLLRYYRLKADVFSVIILFSPRVSLSIPFSSCSNQIQFKLALSHVGGRVSNGCQFRLYSSLT